MLGALNHGYIVDENMSCIELGLLYLLAKDSLKHANLMEAQNICKTWD
jgi:hypothetical protein